MEDPAGKKSILIVDDEAPFRFAAGVALRRKGYRVSEAGEGGRPPVASSGYYCNRVGSGQWPVGRKAQAAFRSAATRLEL